MQRLRKTLKKYFIPHEENDHRPHILRWQTVAFVLVVALGVEGILWYGSSNLAPKSSLFGIIVANTLIDETNQNRVANGDVALTVSPLLEAAAQDKANDMVENNYFAHTSPSGLTPWYWFEQVGYNFTSAGENLAVNFSDSEDVTNAWMNSPEHRANILNTSFTQIGIATATGTYNGHPATYVVELFGTPALTEPAAPIAFVNSASAAGVPASTKTQTQAQTKSKQTKSAPVALATDTLDAATSNPTFVAIQGAATGSFIASTQDVTETPPTAPAVAVAETNPIQAAAANPRSVVDDIYFAIIVLFAIALGLNIFIKIHVQHSQVIFAGMLVILVAGLLIILNEHALAGTVIL